MSGAGKSTALKVFEDLGFICVDGLPPGLIPEMVSLFMGQDEIHHRGLTLGMDVRQTDFLSKWEEARDQLDGMGVGLRIVFIDCKDSVLMRRYAATRRPHPLESEDMGLERAVETERKVLAEIRAKAEIVVDTSDYSIHDLRRVLQEKWNFLKDKKYGLKVYLVSFGFKYGLPMEADMVFDLRFLPNPHFDDGLRPLTGKESEVSEYVLGSPEGGVFAERLTGFLEYLLPQFAREGRYRLTVAIGCTGGRHRSVAVSERVFDSLRNSDYAVSLEHRHIALG
jgi:UPF0042 nucleotide-binding protein